MKRLLGKFLCWLFDLWIKKSGFDLEIEKETTKTKFKFHKD